MNSVLQMILGWAIKNWVPFTIGLKLLKKEGIKPSFLEFVKLLGEYELSVNQLKEFVDIWNKFFPLSSDEQAVIDAMLKAANA